jgi:Tol biopolymer transport system component
MKRGVATVLIGASRVGNTRLVAVLVVALASVLAASVLALVAARTAEAAFPGGNGKIAFQSDRHGPVEIYAMTPGETATRITTSNNSYDPSYSPDGRRIAFISGSKTNSSDEVWVMNADGSGRRQVTKTSVAEQESAWSPDGTRLVYASNSFDVDRQTDLEIWTINADGSRRRQLTNNTSGLDETQPAWSPDEAKIAYVGVASGSLDRNIYVMNANGTGQGPVDTSTARDINPDWQPITLAVNDVRMKEKSANAVFIVSLPTASEETITVNYATADGTAKTPADYTAASGTLTFEPGQTTQQIAVPIRGDRRNERNERFFVDLSGATNAAVSDAQGQAMIVDND